MLLNSYYIIAEQYSSIYCEEKFAGRGPFGLCPRAFKRSYLDSKEGIRLSHLLLQEGGGVLPRVRLRKEVL